jgi:hypothetical protein
MFTSGVPSYAATLGRWLPRVVLAAVGVYEAILTKLRGDIEGMLMIVHALQVD